MFNAKLLVMGAVALALTTACSSKPKKQEAAAPTPAEQAKTQLASDRDAYVGTVQQRIDQLAKVAGDLRTRAGATQKPQSKKLENASDDMNSLLEDARRELADVKNAAPENWVDEKRDVEKVMSRAETQYSAAVPLLQ